MRRDQLFATALAFLRLRFLLFMAAFEVPAVGASNHAFEQSDFVLVGHAIILYGPFPNRGIGNFCFATEGVGALGGHARPAGPVQGVVVLDNRSIRNLWGWCYSSFFRRLDDGGGVSSCSEPVEVEDVGKFPTALSSSSWR